jgi:hypothetical protein
MSGNPSVLMIWISRIIGVVVSIIIVSVAPTYTGPWRKRPDPAGAISIDPKINASRK